MVIIDQHALHERILYEQLLTKISAGPLESQRMLIPMTFRASPSQLDLLEQVQPMLARLGIDVSPFGPESVAINGFPSFLDRLDPGAFVKELLERGEQELLDLTQEELLHGVLDMMACKAAVKAGDPLTPAGDQRPADAAPPDRSRIQLPARPADDAQAVIAGFGEAVQKNRILKSGSPALGLMAPMPNSAKRWVTPRSGRMRYRRSEVPARA